MHDIIGPLINKDMKGFEFTRMTGDLVKAIIGCGEPVIAAVDGVCVGAGAIIAAASDLRLATSSSKTAFLFTGSVLPVVIWAHVRSCRVLLVRAVQPSFCIPVVPCRPKKANVGAFITVWSIRDSEAEAIALATRISRPEFWSRDDQNHASPGMEHVD